MKVLAVLLLVFSCNTGVYSCYPQGWVSYGNSCYGFSNEKLQWAEAQAACLGFGAHLAVIETRSEGEYLENLARSKGGHRSHWIGATDLMHEGDFTWTTNKQPVHSSANWSPGQPNADREHCVEIRGLFDYKWNDWECTQRAHFICELPHAHSNVDHVIAY